MSAPDSVLLAHKVSYRRFSILVKRDFGDGFHRIDGMPVAWGYVVTDGICNVIPGAGWFLTVEDAKVGIDALHDVGAPAEIKDCRSWGQAWHDRYRAIRNAQRAGDDLLAALRDAVELIDHLGRGNGEIAKRGRAAIAKAEGR